MTASVGPDGVLLVDDDFMETVPAVRDADLEAFHEMLSGIIRYVEGRIDAGWTADRLVEVGIPAQWASWRGELLPDGFVLRNLYEGVRRRRTGPGG